MVIHEFLLLIVCGFHFPSLMMKTLLAISLASALAVVVVVEVRRRRNVPPVKEVSRTEFVEVMKIVAINIFNKLFEYAQTAQRVIAMQREDREFSRILENDKLLALDLASVQRRVLEQFGLTEADVVCAQKGFYHTGDPELDRIVDSVSVMFQQFVDGKFPVLPLEVLPEERIVSDEDLLALVEEILNAKVALVTATPGDPLRLGNQLESMEEEILKKVFFSKSAMNNQVAQRMNAAGSFRVRLMQVVLHAQTAMKTFLNEAR